MRRSFILCLMLLAVLTAMAQTRTLTGTVTDSTGAPVPNVSVTVRNSGAGTSTNETGRFSIEVAPGSVLVFSAVGFQPLQVSVTNEETLNVVLQGQQQNLQEVVVTGYTTRSRREVTGSVARLRAEEISLQPVGSFDKALQGKVPGLLSLSQSGQPGSPAQVTIRGKGSILGSNTPLYVVDGVQVNAADFATINPNDIETYNVLKDASAASIYGSRGANGVIVITTKRGIAGPTRIDYDFQYGFSELPENRLQLMNSAQKLDYEVNYDRPDFGMNFFGWTPEDIDSLSKIDNGIVDALFRKGITQQHHLSASGGNERTRFYLSGSLFDQQGIVKTTGLKRYTGRANLDNTFGAFRIGLNATLGYSRLTGTRENDAYVGSPLNAIRWFNPYITLFDAEGKYQDDFLQGQPNPLRELLENRGSSDQLKGVGSAYVEFAVPWVAGLRARTLWGTDYTQDEVFGYLDRNTNQGSQSTGGSGQVDRSFARVFRYTGTTSLNYQRTFGDHELNISLFNEIIKAKSRSFGFSGFGLVGPFKNEAGITPGTPTNGFIPTVTGTGSANALLSYFIDGVYGYRRKYYLSFGARRDGSSRLAEGQRWNNFGQLGLSWIVSEEDFLQNAPWLGFLKFKASYGSVGSQGVGDFATRQLLSPAVYSGVGGLLLTSLETPLSWERKVILNTGVEFALWQGRINGALEYYNNTTKDVFVNRQLSRTTGFASILNNLGRIRNQGIEAAIDIGLIRNQNFNWLVSANYTYNKNEVLELQQGQDQNVNGIFITKVGEPLNSLYLVRYAGVDPQTGEALYYKADGKTTTPDYDPNDRVLLGTIDPPHFGGFSTEWRYKGVGLEVLFSYAFGNKLYNNDRTNVENPIYWYSNLAASMLREWRQPGDITDVPSAFSNFRSETSRFVEDGDFLRLRNVTLSYNLPKSLLERIKIRSAQVFAQGQNLRVWHNFLGYDPEVVTGNLVGAQYPQLKTFTFGLNLGL